MLNHCSDARESLLPVANALKRLGITVRVAFPAKLEVSTINPDGSKSKSVIRDYLSGFKSNKLTLIDHVVEIDNFQDLLDKYQGLHDELIKGEEERVAKSAARKAKWEENQRRIQNQRSTRNIPMSRNVSPPASQSQSIISKEMVPANIRPSTPRNADNEGEGIQLNDTDIDLDITRLPSSQDSTTGNW